MIDIVIKKTITYIIILIIVIGLCRFVSDNFVMTKNFKTESEIIDIFNENKETFVNVSKDLFEFKYHWSLRMERYNDEIRTDWKSVILNSGIQLVIQDQDHINEISLMQNAVENKKSIDDIMKKLKFKIITSNSRVDSECIYFVKQTAVGFDSGIIYSPNGKPQNPYIEKLTTIDSSWYYYESK